MASTSFMAGRSNAVGPEVDKRSFTAPASPICGNQGSVRQQHCQLYKLTVLTVVPGLILFCRCIVDLVNDTEALLSNKNILEQISFSVSVGGVIHSCQEERGTTALFVSSDGDPSVRERLLERYHNTDTRIFGLSKWIPIQEPAHFRSRDLFHNSILNFRSTLTVDNTTLFDVIRFYSDNNQVFIDLMSNNLSPERSVSYWKNLVAYNLLILSKEQAGVERALGSTSYARGNFPLDELLWYKDKFKLGENYLKQSMSYSTYTRGLIDAYYTGSQLSGDLGSMRRQISENNASTPSVINGTVWFDSMTEYINILKKVQDALATKISQIAFEENATLQTLLWSSALQVAIATFVLPIVTILNRNIVRKIQAYGSDLAVRTKELEDEKKRTEMLLQQLIPRSIAKKLIQNVQVIPEAFKSVTILFSDVCDFVNVSGQCSPFEAIQILNAIYCLVDEQIEKHDVYRVDIAGAGYMVASGVPRRNGVKHVEEIARLSLDLMAAMSERHMPHIEDVLNLRIGFHTGPCAAGIIGNIMPRYCIFGDTVSIASRMESTGLPSKIQTTERCANILLADKNFKLIAREPVELKDKDGIKTFWLEGLA